MTGLRVYHCGILKVLGLIPTPIVEVAFLDQLWGIGQHSIGDKNMRNAGVALILAGSVVLAQDPLRVAAGQYRLVADNENVRVLEANLGPGAKTAMHSHPALMAVMLQVSATKWTMPDGTSAQSAPDMKRGSVIAMDAQSHVSENVGKTPAKVILIEFKKPAPPASEAKRVPTQRECKLVAESAHASAQLCSGAAGSTVAQHTHFNDVVYVALTDVTAEITAADGKKRVLEMRRDEARIAPPETHSALNTGQGAFELLVVNLK